MLYPLSYEGGVAGDRGCVVLVPGGAYRMGPAGRGARPATDECHC